MKISVKSKLSEKGKHFTLTEKAETIVDKNLFYIFVRMNEFKRLPDYWVVPSKRVAEITKLEHLNWLRMPSRGGREHKENPMRSFSIIQKSNFPNDWEEEVKKYKSNIKILEDF